MDEYYLPISALQHYAYCPRQCALIHTEQVWAENHSTIEGLILHERVDSGASETRKNTRTERGVHVVSNSLKIIGKLDLLEIQIRTPKQYCPVEYKKGKSKIQNWDRVQLCAQALCLEEMLQVKINEGALWYWQTRHREIVLLNENIRVQTLQIIRETQALFASKKTPRSIYEKKCHACSLIDLCGVKNLATDNSKYFVDEIFKL